jgi:O-antigen/teichoic acid export membrane protein
MQTLIRAIPRHVWVAISAWISRAVVAVVSLMAIRLLLQTLGTDQYSVFAILSGLTGWFFLFDLGTGVSAQNYISERRANHQPSSDFIAAGTILSIALLLLATAILLIAGPAAARFLFGQYPGLSIVQKRDLFLTVGFLSSVVALAGFVNRVWYARQLGFLANLAPAIGPVVGLGLIKLVSASAIADKLYWSCVAFFAPPALLMVAAACTLLPHIPRQPFATVWEDIKQILRRGRGHWLFAVLATATLKVDYIIMSQLLRGGDIVSYNIASMLFTSVFFIYAAMLTALWPNCAEAIARNRWDVIGAYLRRYIALGIALIILSTLLIAAFRPQILHLLSPATPVSLNLGLVCLFGGYFVIRVWTDTFGMILQSISAMKIFLVVVPVEATIAVALQIIFVRRLGPVGVPAALIVAYLCTVSWTMPVTLYRKHRAAIEQLAESAATSKTRQLTASSA